MSVGDDESPPMPDAQKKPCSICRRWFRPDPRVGKRQRACGQADCQAVHRRKMQAAWRRRNPDYFVARRMQERGTQEQPAEPLRLPSPLSRLPWDVAQSEFGVQGADFLGVMGKVLLRPGQSEFWAYPLDSKRVVGTLPPPVAQSEFRAYALDSKPVAGTLPPPLAQSEIPGPAG
jgi:hypothetical protein